MNSIFACIEITTDENISNPIYNGIVSEDDESRPDIVYSEITSDSIPSFPIVNEVWISLFENYGL